MIARYRLVDEEQDALGIASDVDGFFVEREKQAQVWRAFRLVDCEPSGLLRRFCTGTASGLADLGNVELQILNEAGQPMGAYFIGSATADRCDSQSVTGLMDIFLTGLLLSQPHPAAKAI